MSLFRKKCEYCRSKIEKGKEIFRNVKVPEFTGTRERAFCCSEHANNYEKEVGEHMKKGGKSCCG